jgi:hypothetical protein
VAIDWERLEAEIAETAMHEDIADRVLRAARRRRRRRQAVLGAAATIAVGAAVAPALLLGSAEHTRSAESGPHPVGVPRAALGGSSIRAQIYAAALAGGPDPQPLRGRLYVHDRVCVTVPEQAAAACTGAIIRAEVQRDVTVLLGPQVRFSGTPPGPDRLGDPSVVTFGRLTVHGAEARLGLQVTCGPLCGVGETLVLRRRGGQWQVTGTIGPRWIS